MPYRSGLIQTALGALFAATFLISNSFSSPASKQKRVAGTIQKTDQKKICLTESNGRQHTFDLAENTAIYLNERPIAFSQIEAGRTASVLFEKKRDILLAKVVEIFPTHDDFNRETNQSPSA